MVIMNSTNGITKQCQHIRVTKQQYFSDVTLHNTSATFMGCKMTKEASKPSYQLTTQSTQPLTHPKSCDCSTVPQQPVAPPDWLSALQVSVARHQNLLLPGIHTHRCGCLWMLWSCLTSGACGTATLRNAWPTLSSKMHSAWKCTSLIWAIF